MRLCHCLCNFSIHKEPIGTLNDACVYFVLRQWNFGGKWTKRWWWCFMLYGIVVPSLMGKRFRIKILGGGFKCFIYVFTPKVGEDFQSDEYFFSDGLVQPPTRIMFKHLWIAKVLFLQCWGLKPAIHWRSQKYYRLLDDDLKDEQVVRRTVWYKCVYCIYIYQVQLENMAVWNFSTAQTIGWWCCKED